MCVDLSAITLWREGHVHCGNSRVLTIRVNRGYTPAVFLVARTSSGGLSHVSSSRRSRPPDMHDKET